MLLKREYLQKRFIILLQEKGLAYITFITHLDLVTIVS